MQENGDIDVYVFISIFFDICQSIGKKNVMLVRKNKTTDTNVIPEFNKCQCICLTNRIYIHIHL